MGLQSQMKRKARQIHPIWAELANFRKKSQIFITSSSFGCIPKDFKFVNQKSKSTVNAIRILFSS